MEKDRKLKMIAIISLIVTIAGLTLGFAALSNTLDISPNVTVTPNESNFKVLFSSSKNGLETDAIKATTTAAEGVTAGQAKISNDGVNSIISGITAGFTEPGQSVTYTFWTHNAGEYTAYLKNITFTKINNSDAIKACIPKDPINTSVELVNAACNDINLKVTVGSIAATSSLSGLSEALAKKENEEVTVTITYENKGNLADGEFEVMFGDVSLTYSSAK